MLESSKTCGFLHDDDDGRGLWRRKERTNWFLLSKINKLCVGLLRLYANILNNGIMVIIRSFESIICVHIHNKVDIVYIHGRYLRSCMVLSVL